MPWTSLYAASAYGSEHDIKYYVRPGSQPQRPLPGDYKVRVLMRMGFCFGAFHAVMRGMLMRLHRHHSIFLDTP